MKRISILIVALALGALLIPVRWVSLGAPNVSGSMFRLTAEPQRQGPPERLVALNQLDSLPVADQGDSPVGRDPRRWRALLASKVNQRFQEVFPGVDLVFAGTAKRMEAILIVKPGVDPASVVFNFPQAEAVGADAQANIWVAMPGGDLGFMRPLLSRQNEKVSGSFAIQGSRVVLQVQDHDSAQPLLVRFDVVFPERPVNLLDQILYRTFKAENYQPTSPASPEQTTTVTATKAVDNANTAPGGTLMYTVTITNTGAQTATGVQFTDTISNNTTLVGGSVASSPIGQNDSYTATGNIPISPTNGVLANDIDPDTGNNTGLTVTQVQGLAANVGVATSTSAAGFGAVNGSVTVQPNGSFTYEPPPGFTGNDTFTYRVADAGGKSNDATVTINITGKAWFINNNSPGSLNRGTFTHPFTSIVNFNTANTGAALRPSAGDTISLRTGLGTYSETDGVNLLNNQVLIGEGVQFSLFFTADANSTAAYTTFASAAGTAPAITTSGGNGIDLASGNTVRGLNVGNTPGFFGFNGTAVGTLTVSSVNKTGTGGAINISTSGAFGSTVNFGTLESTSSPAQNLNLVNVTGTLGVASGGGGLSGSLTGAAAVILNGGSVSLTYPGNVSKTNAGALVAVTNGHNGTLTFNTGILSANSNSTGLQFLNADGNYNFNGTTTLTDTGIGISSGSDGTLTFGTGASIMAGANIVPFNLDGGTATVTYSGAITKTGNGDAIKVQGGHATGVVTFQTGTISVTGGNGLQFDNADSTYNFNGTTTLNGGDAAVDIFNGSAGNFTFSANTSVTNPSGTAFRVDGGNGTITYNGTLSKTSTSGRLIDIGNRNGGSVSFTSTLTSSGSGATGILVQNNTSGSPTFTFSGATKTLSTSTNAAVTLSNNATSTTNFSNGGLDIDTTSGAGFSASSSGIVTVTTGANPNTIDSTTGTALSVTSTTIGASGLTFRSISANGGANGIVLDTTGSSGGLTVTGDGTNTTKGGNATGGTIQNMVGADGATAGNGIYLNSTQNVSLRRMQLNDFQNSAIRGFNVNGFTFQYSTINGVSGNASGPTEGCISFGTIVPAANGLIGGTNLVDNCNIRGGVEHNLEFYTHLAASNYSLTVSNSDVKSNSAALGGDGIQIETGGTYANTATISVQNVAFDDNKSQAVQAAANGSSTIDITINNCTLQRTTQGNEGWILSNGSNGDLIAHVTNNTSTGIGGVVIFVGQTPGNATSSSSLTAVVSGNTITHPTTATNHAIFIAPTSTLGQVSTANILVQSNTITENSTSGVARGILVDTPDASTSPAFTASILSNSVSVGDNVNGVAGIVAQARQSSAGCFDVRSNTVTFPNGTPAGVFGIRVRQVAPATANLEQGISAGAAATVLAANNAASTTEVLGTVNVVGNSTCQTAPTFAPPAGSVEERVGLNRSLEWVDQVVSTIAEPLTAAEYFKIIKQSPFPAATAAPPVTEQVLQTSKPTEGGGSRITMSHLLRPVLSAYAASMGYVNPLKWFEASASAAPAGDTTEKPAVEKKSTPEGKTTLSAQDRPQRPQRTEGKTEAPQRQQPRPPTRILASPESGETVMVGPFNLPPGESVQIMFSVTVTGTTGCSISNQATVSGSNFTSVTTNAATTAILQAPSAITCPGNITGTTDPGQCTSVETFATPTTSAGCPTPTVTCLPASGFAFPVGMTTVTCTASNGQGSPTTCSFTVTITDNQIPTLTCPAPVSVNTAPGVCTATATYAPVITDNCPGATAACVPPSGSTFNIGVTTVNCTGMDVNGNNAVACSFTVTVVDNQNPVIGACPTNITLPATAGACSATATYTTPTAMDNCGAAPVVCAPASGSTFPVGTTTVTCTATDSSNRTATCTFTVTIQDTEAPTIMCPSNQTVSSNVPVIVNYPAPTANDNCGAPTVNCVPASGTSFVVGTTTVTCTASDTSVNSLDATCSFTVSVVPCTVNCPGNQTAVAPVGACAATVNYPAPTTTGTCGTVTCVPASGASFPVGITTVTCTSAAGPSCSFTVTVTDNQVPTLTCPANITTNTTAGTCAANVTYTTPTASDNCPGATVICTPASGTSFAKGVTTVTCTAKDASNNMAMCSFTVTVNDNIPPAITCPANITLNTAAGVCTAVATYTTPTPTDNCPGATAVCVPASGSTFQKGVTTVTCTASDTATPPNTASCTFTVTVTDNQDPVIGACPSNITQPATTGACNAVVTYTPPTATDNCGAAPVVCAPASGSTFNVGTTTVTCTATDSSNRTASCTFTVTIQDTQAPTITCPANQTVSSNVPIVVNYPAPTANDNCGAPTVVCVPASGTVFVVGTTTVTCTASDTSINSPDATCSFTVSVIPCTVTCPGNQTANAAPGLCSAVVTYPAPTTTGTCGTVTCTPASGSSFTVGITTVTCTAAVGQSCSFIVTVTDTQLPTLTCPTNIVTNTAPGICTAVATYTTPTASDNCPGATVTCAPASGSTFQKGVTTVTCTAKDASNNMAMCTFTVTVNDNQNPGITCPANITLNTAAGICTAVATYTTPTPTDNCPGATAACVPASGSTFQKGVTTVTCTATDASNNTAACTFTVTVNDNQNPAITCPANIALNTAPGLCSAVATFTTPTPTDNCPGATAACVPASGSTFQKGVTTVTCTATDTSNNTAACTFTVTVTDNQNPTITCPANQTATSLGGPIAVTYPAPTATDNCPGVTTACVPASGSVFPLGTTTVNCTATDAVSRTATCSFTVTVITCTSITCPTDIFVGTTGNSTTVNYTLPTANGNCGTITCTPASGSTFNVGVTTVSCASSIGNQTCAFRVTVNRVSGSLSDPLACTGPGNTVSATLVISNNGNVNQTVADTTTFTNLVGVPGSCTVAPNVGTCSVTNGNLTYNGTLSPGQTVTISYLTQVNDLAPSGAQVCTNNSVTFNGGPPFAFSVCDVVDCPVAGPGGPFPARAEASDQKAGSVLIYNIYTSGSTNANTQNTRINITNSHLVLPAYVHMFFVSEGCAVADNFICLTGNQTASFLASDLDPGTTGYIVAVAVDAQGCPINFNYLIGDEYVKFSSGHASNLAAEAFAALPGGLPACDQNSSTATISFDGVNYNRTPATLALDSVGARADGNDTLLILNRIGGNLGIGAASLGTLFGLLYDDTEASVSFSVTGSCQLRNSLTNNFPRTTPRFETFIPAGRTGWLKIYNQTGAIGITGAAINFNPNASSSAGAFNQGHNLHHLTLNNSMSYIIPVFPPSC